MTCQFFKNLAKSFSSITDIKLVPVVFLLLTGCQTANIRDDYSLDAEAKKNTAIIVGSVTQNPDTALGTVADFRIDYKSDKETKIMYSKETNPLIGAIANRYEFQDGKSGGRIFVLEVDAGQHQLDYWSIDHNNNDLRLYPKVLPSRLEFTVEPGQIKQRKSRGQST